jgi:hypothetical protein
MTRNRPSLSTKGIGFGANGMTYRYPVRGLISVKYLIMLIY